MDNNILIAAKQKIQDNKFNAEYNAQKNYQTAMADATFKQLYEKISTLNHLMAKAEINENVQELKKLQLEFSKLELQQQKLLKKLGLTASDFEPNYSCKLCHDTGYYNGKACRCVKMLMNDYLMESIGIDIKNLNTFKHSDTSKYPSAIREKMDKSFDYYFKYSIGFTENSKGLLLIGPPGTGKTFILNAIASYLYSKGFIVSYNTSFSFNQLALKYHTTFDEQKAFILENLTEADLLIIDDLGVEPILRNVTIEYFYAVINDRYIKNKPTIVSTNLSLTELNKRYGERTISRLVDKEKSICKNIQFSDNLRTLK